MNQFEDDPIEEHVDPVRRKSFFYNKETNQSGWSRESVSSPRGSMPPRTSISRGSFHGGPTLDQQASIAQETQMTVDPSSGRTFYYNRVTGISGWTRQEAEGVQPTAAEGPPSSPVPAIARPTSDHIEERMDHNRGRPYFFNRITKKVGWSREEVMDSPLGGEGGIPPPPPQAPTQRDEIKAVKDPSSGRTYYVNMRTQKTGWSQEEVEEETDDMLDEVKFRTRMDHEKNLDMRSVIGGDQLQDDWVAKVDNRDEAEASIRRAEQEAQNVLRKAKEMARAAKQRAVQEAEQALSHATQLAEDSRNRALVRAESAIARSKAEEEKKRQLAMNAKAKYDKTVEARDAMMRRLNDECMARQEVMEEAAKEHEEAKRVRQDVEKTAADLIQKAKEKCEKDISQAEAEVFGSSFARNLFEGKVVQVVVGADKGKVGRLLHGIKDLDPDERYQVKLKKTGEIKNYGGDRLKMGEGNEDDESDEEGSGSEESGSEESGSGSEEDEDGEGQESGGEGEEEGEGEDEDGEGEGEEEESGKGKKKKDGKVNKNKKSTKKGVKDAKNEKKQAEKLSGLNGEDGAEEGESVADWLKTAKLSEKEEDFTKAGVTKVAELGLFEAVDLETMGIKKLKRPRLKVKDIREQDDFKSMVEELENPKNLEALVEKLSLEKADKDKFKELDDDFEALQKQAAESISNDNPKKDGKEAKSRKELKDKLDEALEDLSEVHKLKILYALAKQE